MVLLDFSFYIIIDFKHTISIFMSSILYCTKKFNTLKVFMFSESEICIMSPYRGFNGILNNKHTDR